MCDKCQESNTHFLHFSSFAVVVFSEFNVVISNVSIIQRK